METAEFLADLKDQGIEIDATIAKVQTLDPFRSYEQTLPDPLPIRPTIVLAREAPRGGCQQCARRGEKAKDRWKFGGILIHPRLRHTPR